MDNAFDRATAVTPGSEVQSDLARLLCVRVLGLLEISLEDAFARHVSTKAAPAVVRYCEATFRAGSLNYERLQQVVRHFDEKWPELIDEQVGPDGRAAIDSLYGLRNQIAHGEDVGPSLGTIQGYYRYVKEIIELVDSLSVGAPKGLYAAAP
jgi:hypothetical protein